MNLQYSQCMVWEIWTFAEPVHCYTLPPMEAFKYFGDLMKQGTVSTDDLQNAWRFANNYPQRPYLALMGQQLELPPQTDQGLVLVDTLLADEAHNLDLATVTMQDLPDYVSVEVRNKMAEALAGLRAGQVMLEESNSIKKIDIDQEQLEQHLLATGRAWYMRTRTPQS